MRPVVVTACTNRKRSPPLATLRARDLPAGEVSHVAAEWLGRLTAADGSLTSANQLYCGRSFREAEGASDALGARLLIVSAGLGLVEAQVAVPSYNLTLSAESLDCVLRRARGSAREWWSAISSQSPFATGDVDSGGLILAALSRPYLDMIAADWVAWPKERLQRLRLFCKDPPEHLDQRLRAQWIPYDDRLDQIAGSAGTQGDFAQRALSHFAKTFAAQPASAADHRDAVLTSLAPLQAAARPNRDRQSDASLIALILQEWDAVNGRSGAMLIRLRRELDVACEQARFKTLFKQAAAQRQGVLL